MAFCNKCGKKLDADTMFCPHCGNPVPKQRQTAGFDLNQIDMEGSDTTASYNPSDIMENKYLCILCYLHLLILIPLLVKRDSPFVRFHCNQGLLTILLGLAGSLLAIVPFLGPVVAGICSLAVLVLRILGIVNACRGTAKTLPIIGGITLIH